MSYIDIVISVTNFQANNIGFFWFNILFSLQLFLNNVILWELLISIFIIGDWNAKVGSKETPGVTGKFGLGIRKEAGQILIEFCQENALLIATPSSKTQEKTLYMDITRWSTPKSD